MLRDHLPGDVSEWPSWVPPRIISAARSFQIAMHRRKFEEQMDEFNQRRPSRAPSAQVSEAPAQEPSLVEETPSARRGRSASKRKAEDAEEGKAAKASKVSEKAKVAPYADGPKVALPRKVCFAQSLLRNAPLTPRLHSATAALTCSASCASV